MAEHIQLREAHPEEYTETLRIWQRVYGSQIFGEERLEPLAFQRFLIGHVEGVAAFAAIVCDYPTYLRGRVVSSAGIAAVATLPEFRGDGVGQQMMDRSMAWCREKGYVISSLYGFREPFYRKSGFESCGWRWRISCPRDQMASGKGDLAVHEVNANDFVRLDRCYQEFVSRFSGSCQRSEAHWSRRLGRSPAQIYAVGDPVEGYLWCNPHGFWNDLEIGEIAWSTPRGYQNLLRLMRNLAINKERVIWCEPPESPYLSAHLDGGVEVARHRPTMFAVLDPVKAIGEDADWSDFSFEFGGELIGTGPRIEFSATQLAQVIMGSPSLAELVRWGQVSGDDDALAALQHILPPEAVCSMEFF